MKVTRFAMIAALSLAAVPASAATYTFNVAVVESIDLPTWGLDFPDLGTVGTISFTLDAAALDGDGDPSTFVGSDMPLNPALADASASIAGLTASLSGATIYGFPGRARFSNGDFSPIEVNDAGANCPPLGCTLAGNFSVYATGTPVSFADVEAMLNDPLATVRFSFNGTAAGEYVSFAAETAATPVIPLPASGVLMLAVLGAGAAFARRSSRG
ncbi:hypothetical protein [Paracoccus sp. (in: a-proteobacteria)]|uniref:hypothetical protein n=1 Tax=Paracoccus sp. TaxID=267 RepID=UPI003A838366